MFNRCSAKIALQIWIELAKKVKYVFFNKEIRKLIKNDLRQDLKELLLTDIFEHQTNK